MKFHPSISFISEDEQTNIIISRCHNPEDESNPGYEIEVWFHELCIGSIFFDRYEDMVMLNNCLAEFLESYKRKEDGK